MGSRTCSPWPSVRRGSRAMWRSGQDRCPGHALSEGQQKAKSAPELELALQATTEVNSVPLRFSLLQGELDNMDASSSHICFNIDSGNECVCHGLTLAMENERSKWQSNV